MVAVEDGRRRAWGRIQGHISPRTRHCYGTSYIGGGSSGCGIREVKVDRIEREEEPQAGRSSEDVASGEVYVG